MCTRTLPGLEKAVWYRLNHLWLKQSWLVDVEQPSNQQHLKGSNLYLHIGVKRRPSSTALKAVLHDHGGRSMMAQPTSCQAIQLINLDRL
jgi:hypothetical protein